MRLGGLVVVCLLAACSNGTGLKAGARATGGGSADQQKKPAAEAQKPTGAQEQASSGTSPETPKEPDDEKTDDELRVIPPEVVSGAFLTCDYDDTDAATYGHVRYGCEAVLENGDHADLTGFKQQWVLMDALYSHPLAAKELPIPTGSKLHHLWEVPVAMYETGVKARLVLEGADGTTATLKTHGTVIINGEVQQDQVQSQSVMALQP